MQSAKAIIVRGESMLILKKGDTFKLPGGHLEKGETFEQALVREVFEETKLSITILADLGAWSGESADGERLSGRTFLCTARDAQVVLDGTEHDAFDWIPLQNVHEPFYPAWLSRVVRKAEKEWKRHG